GQVKHGPARGRMDEADQVAPGVAMLHRGSRALAIETPDFVQDGFEADPMLIDRPQVDLRLREGRGHAPQQRPYIFLNASCCARSARMWRGRGLRRLPSRRTK